MAKKKNKKKKQARSTEPIKYEDSATFKAIDRMMRQNQGIKLESH